MAANGRCTSKVGVNDRLSSYKSRVNKLLHYTVRVEVSLVLCMALTAMVHSSGFIFLQAYFYAIFDGGAAHSQVLRLPIQLILLRLSSRDIYTVTLKMIFFQLLPKLLNLGL